MRRLAASFLHLRQPVREQIELRGEEHSAWRAKIPTKKEVNIKLN